MREMLLKIAWALLCLICLALWNFIVFPLAREEEYERGLRDGYAKGRKEAEDLQRNVSTEGKWY